MSDQSCLPDGWITAADLVGVGGMPGTERSVRRMADVAGWPSQVVQVGGRLRRCFAIESLPPATRAALGAAANDGTAAPGAHPAAAAAAAKAHLQENMVQRSREARRQAALRQSPQLPAARQAVMDAKLAVMTALAAWVKERGISMSEGIAGFVTAYNAGHVAIDGAVRQAVTRVSVRSIWRWNTLVREHGISALAGDYGTRPSTALVDADDDLRRFVVGMLVQYPHCHASHVRQALTARFGTGDSRLPSDRSLRRWIGEWRRANAQTLLAVANPDAWKNRYLSAFGSQSEGVERVNQRWEMDSTPGDVMLEDGRHSVIGVIDVRSRRLRLLVSRTSKATAVAALIRRALLDWGVPEEAKTDNGSDYVSNHITRVFKSLDVDHQTCEPFSPWQKPHIERALGTFSHALVELLSEFIGHNVAERSAIEARRSFADRLMKRDEVVEIRMTSQAFQDFCDSWTDDIYQHTPHTGLDGRTPFEVAAAARDTLRRIADERTLDVLLAAAPGGDGWRVVGKKGITLDGGVFIAPELEAWIGQRVRVLYDEVEHDLGTVFVFGGEDMQFICRAECPERTGMDRREVAIRAREMQKARVQAERRALKEVAKKAGVDQVVDEILRTRATEAGKLSALPAPSERHESAGLDAAAAAAASLDQTPAAGADVIRLEDLAGHMQRMRAQAEADEAGVPVGSDNELARRRAASGIQAVPAFETMQERAQWLLQQQHFRELTGEERAFLTGYRRDHLASYRRMESIAAELHQLATNEEESRRTGTGPAPEAE